MAEAGRTVPFALEAEQSVLGAILIDPEKFNDIGSIMTGDDFYIGEHREIFAAMQELFVKNRDITSSRSLICSFPAVCIQRMK